jgi:hypothetical protein
LNALMCTATPSSGTQMCRPTNVPPFDSISSGRRRRTSRSGTPVGRATRRRRTFRCRPRCPPTSRIRRARRGGHDVELVLSRHQVLRHRLEHQRALVERHPPQRGPPTSRA